MIILNAGYTVSVTIADGESLTVESRGGTTVTAVSGLGVTAGLLDTVDGSQTFGPYSAGVISIAAVGGDCSYDVNARHDVEWNADNTGLIVNGRRVRRFPLTSGTLKKSLAGKFALYNVGAAAVTHHQQIVLAAPAYAFRVGVFNIHTAAKTGVKAIIAPTNTFGGPGSFPGRDPSGAWVSMTWGGSATGTLAAGAAARPSITWTDWAEMATVARTDGGTLPVIHLRIMQPGDGVNNHFTALSLGSLVNWRDTVNVPSDRRFFAIQQNVDGVTTPTNFTTPSGSNDPVAIVLEYAPLTRGRTLLIVGDSTSMSAGSIPGMSEVVDAAFTASTPANPIEVCNLAWGGFNTGQYYLHALDALASIKADYLVYPPFSPNDGTPSATTIDAAKMRLGRVIAQAEQYGTEIVLANGLPTTPGILGLTWGAADAFRTAFNAEMTGYGYTVYDRATPVSGVTDGSGQVLYNPLYSSDNLHVSDAGRAYLKAFAKTDLGL